MTKDPHEALAKLETTLNEFTERLRSCQLKLNKLKNLRDRLAVQRRSSMQIAEVIVEINDVLGED